ncbi:MAG: B12-binding domain-containing radical SAM protein [Desulfuromonas sp.]|nr:MAG: B12-binding domain-containing radical SAM protein [Desulfuromonas sp.]
MKQLSALTEVSRPSRYLGGELGSRSFQSDQIDLRIALAFPDVYEIGMSHIGFPILYQTLNQIDGIAAERAYAPWPDMAAWLTEHDEPLCALESGLPLSHFDIIGFTLQYELSYTNLLGMLKLAGVPLRRDQRDEDAPLILVGGPCAFNPEPLADFFDCAIIGDGEEAIVEFCAAVREGTSAGLSRAELLQTLSKIEGVYVPALFDVAYHTDGRIRALTPRQQDYTSVRRRFVNDLETATFPTQPIVPFMQTVHNRVAIEIARGCTRGCRFCQAGYIYRPVRERSPQKIAEIIDAALENSGYEEISLLSLSTGDYSCIEPLIKALMARHAEDQVAVSLPSLRVGSLTPELMEEIKKVRKTGFTLAPEAGTERLRSVINKGISEDDLLKTTEDAYSLGWRLIKLYFMMGLPTETDADLEALIELAARVKRTGKGTQGGADVNVAVSTFVPKPHTPFQWQPQLSIEQVKQRQQRLKDGLKKRKLRFKYHEAELSFLEGVFARGDRRLGAVLEEAVALGCRFDGWREHFNFELWQQAFTNCDIDPDWYLRERDEDEILPWDHIDCGLPKSYFQQERQQALREAATPDCRHGVCNNCGVCDFKQLRMRLIENPPAPIDLPPHAAANIPDPDDETRRFKIRLRLSKTGRARMVGHLEYLTMFQRAVRRAKLPVRFSQGFHPTPKISYLEALPLGVESDTELIDIELYQPPNARQLVTALNRQLPEGFSILEGKEIHWRTPSPSASVASSVYRISLPPEPPQDLDQRIERLLKAETLPLIKHKKGKEIHSDLRPDLIGLRRVENELELHLTKGSPLQITALLLETDVELVRKSGVRKTAINVKF